MLRIYVFFSLSLIYVCVVIQVSTFVDLKVVRNPNESATEKNKFQMSRDDEFDVKCDQRGLQMGSRPIPFEGVKNWLLHV